MRGRSHMNVRLPMAYHPASTCRIPSITHKILDFAVSILVNWKIIPIVDSAFVFLDFHGEILLLVDEKTPRFNDFDGKNNPNFDVVGVGRDNNNRWELGYPPRRAHKSICSTRVIIFSTLGPQQWVSLSTVIVGRGITRNKGSNDQPFVGETHTAETKNP